MFLIEIIKSILFGIVQGITEWLPISSTAHLILLEEFVTIEPKAFFDLFKVVIQVGSILAVVVVYFRTLFPLEKQNGKIVWNKRSLMLWAKVIVACIPAAVIGLLIEDIVDDVLSSIYVVAATLILYGIAFIIIERRNHTRRFKVESVDDLSFGTAFAVGCFQTLALIPGTSRSGSTILGSSLIGVGRKAAAEFSFFLAVPVMFGASGLKMLKFDYSIMTAKLAVVLLVGIVVSFLVSLLAIRFLIGYVRRHSFESFGWYRIVLGALVALWFLIGA